MTEHQSKARQTAEKAFERTKSRSIAREREEHDLVVIARQEKTSRLREARLAMELLNAGDSAARTPDANVRKP
jgi:hypothetical protein